MSGGTKQNGQTNPRSARSSKIKTLAWRYLPAISMLRSEEHTSELQSRLHLVCRLLLEKKKHTYILYFFVSRSSKNSRIAFTTNALSSEDRRRNGLLGEILRASNYLLHSLT